MAVNVYTTVVGKLVIEISPINPVPESESALRR